MLFKKRYLMIPYFGYFLFLIILLLIFKEIKNTKKDIGVLLINYPYFKEKFDKMTLYFIKLA